jgi:hypothetical protein
MVKTKIQIKLAYIRLDKQSLFSYTLSLGLAAGLGWPMGC